MSTKTRLGRVLSSTGKPLYYWAGVTGIAYTKLSDYVCGRLPIAPHHMLVLCDTLVCEPEDLREAPTHVDG